MSKESFIIYKSFWKPISRLSDEQLGRLFRAICLYQTGETPDVADDIVIAYEFFVNQFNIDERKYEEYIEAQRASGKKGASARHNKTDDVNAEDESDTDESVVSPRVAKGRQGSPRVAKACQGSPRVAKGRLGSHGLNDNDNVNDNNIIFLKEKEKEKEKDILEIASEMFVAGSKEPVEEAKRFYAYNEGKTLDEMMPYVSAWKIQAKRDASPEAMKWLAHVVYKARDADLEAMEQIITGVMNITATNSYWLIWCTGEAMKAIEAYACEKPQKNVKYNIT